MQYKAYFDAYVWEDNVGNVVDCSYEAINLDFMQVMGGAARVINFKTTNDISLISELEQARIYKNIDVYLSPRSDGRDMANALFFAECFTKKSNVFITVTIERLEGGNLIEGVSLRASAKIALYPTMFNASSLCVTANLGSIIHLYRGKITPENHYLYPSDATEF